MDSLNNWLGLLSWPHERQPRERGFLAAKASKSLLQRMSLLHTLDSHKGCVNTVVWNETGQYVLSGSDDHRLIVTEPYSKRVLVDLVTSHRANIFSAKFLPGTSDKKIVSCAGDGTLLFTDLERSEATHGCSFTCHTGTSYELLTIPGDPNSFLSCGEDGTVRWFDLRTKERCHKSDCKDDILISLSNAVTSMSLNPLLPFNLAVGSSDASVRIFDRRMLGTKSGGCLSALVSKFSLPEMEGKRRRITSIDFRPDGQEVLVSFSSDHIYTFDPRCNGSKSGKRLFVGHPPRGTVPSGRVHERVPPPLKRLRLRGDWSDTGPNARPEAEEAAANSESQDASRDNPGPTNLMQRMTDALSRMLNDPSTRNAMRSARTNEDSESEQRNSRPAEAEVSESQRAEENSNQSGAQANLQDSNTVEDTSENLGAAAPISTQTPANDATDRTLDCLQESVTKLREEFIDRHKVEPTVNLSLGGQGVVSSVVSIQSSFEPTGFVQSGPLLEAPPPAEASSGEGVMQASSAVVGNDEDVNDDSDAPEPQASNIRDRQTSDASERETFRYSPPFAYNLPGPSQVVTHPGTSGTNSNGERQRRRGVSGPPTGTIEFPSGVSGFVANRVDSNDVDANDDVQEFELDDLNEDHPGSLVLQPESIKKFTGHRNARTMIKEATWWGNDFILSGSDCGHIFGWHRGTERLVLLLEADRHVVNCVQPHPFDPILVSSGIDYNVKVWAPTKEAAVFNEDYAKTLTNRNQIMLEETMDTITVPATLMIRMLASLNQIRRAGRLIPRNVERRDQADVALNDANADGNVGRQRREQSEDDDDGGDEDD